MDVYDKVNKAGRISGFSYVCVAQGNYLITNKISGIRQFLIMGSEKGLLIDTGIGIGSVRAVIDEITSLPVNVLNTHGHLEQCGGNGEFPFVYIDPGDFECYLNCVTEKAQFWKVKELVGEKDLNREVILASQQGLRPVTDGQKFYLGNRTLEIVNTPGHTKGSVCIYDENRGELFSGGTLAEKETYLLDGWEASVETYYQSIQKLSRLPVKKIYEEYAEAPLDQSIIDFKLRCASNILDGMMGEKLWECHQDSIYKCTYNSTSVVYRPRHIYRHRHV